MIRTIWYWLRRTSRLIWPLPEERFVHRQYGEYIRSLFLVLCADRRGEGALDRFRANFEHALAARDAAIKTIKEKIMPNPHTHGSKHFVAAINPTDFHSGKAGGNKIDQAAAQSLAPAMMQAWLDGKVVLVRAETQEIAEEGQNPRARLIMDFEPV